MRTERLLLRRWREDDLEPFAAMNADPHVMRYFPELHTWERSAASTERIERGFEEHGYGLWALETLAEGEFIGFTGLAPVGFEAHFTPAVEVGLAEIVSLTSVHNTPSIAVMRHLGMVRKPADDFLNPNIPAEHWLAPHLLYRLPAPTGT